MLEGDNTSFVLVNLDDVLDSGNTQVFGVFGELLLVSEGSADVVTELLLLLIHGFTTEELHVGDALVGLVGGNTHEDVEHWLIVLRLPASELGNLVEGDTFVGEDGE